MTVETETPEVPSYVERHARWLADRIPVGATARPEFKIATTGIKARRPVFREDIEEMLYEMEDRLGKLITRLCIVMGAIGALVGFLVFVIIGVFI